MKIGIYINGLGQTFSNETVEKYAERLKNEFSFSNKGANYEIKLEKYNYYKNKTTTVASVIDCSDNTLLYKLYEFRYQEILTESFNQKSILTKNLILLSLAITKFPVLVRRMFSSANYNRPYQTFWMFFIFFTIAASVTFLIPGSIGYFLEAKTKLFFDEVKTLLYLKNIDIPFLSYAYLKHIAHLATSLTTILVFIWPSAKALITSLATDFVCADKYLEQGKQKQEIQGNLELLLDYIIEKENEPEIHFHTYSFGSIIGLDFIYPFGRNLTRNSENFITAIITIGVPFDFINAYYKDFYRDRNIKLDDKLCWINIYSISDALASNFRKDGLIADATYGIKIDSKPPINVNYEVIAPKKINLINFLTLYSMQAHNTYWVAKPEGQNCLLHVFEAMTTNKLI